MSTALNETTTARRRSTAGTTRSSFFARVRKSFVRTGGNRGADVKTLRGTKGADFENTCHITRGVPQGTVCCCGWLGRSDESHKERLILIKGPFCFVFAKEDAPAPKYAIGLERMKPKVKSNIVDLETTLGDMEYKFEFESSDIARRFATVVQEQAAAAQTEEVRKQLGHEDLVKKRASCQYAEDVGKKKVKDQPDAPITTQEVMENMPVTPNVM